MTSKDGPIAAFIVGGVALVAAAVLQGIKGSAPPELWSLAFGLLGGALGITLPNRITSAPTAAVPAPASSSTSSSSPAPASPVVPITGPVAAVPAAAPAAGGPS